MSFYKKTLDIVIGENVKKIRMSLGMTQGDMAEMLGITSQQVHKYEHGINRISSSTLLQIAGIFGCDASVLMQTQRLNANDGIIVSENRRNFEYKRKDAKDERIEFVKAFMRLNKKDKDEILDLIATKLKEKNGTN